MILINNMNIATDEIFALLQTKFNVSLASDVMDFPMTCINVSPHEPAVEPSVEFPTADDTAALAAFVPQDEPATIELPPEAAIDVTPTVTSEPIETPFTMEPEFSTLVAQPVEHPECPYVCDVSILTLGLSSIVPVYADTTSSKSYLYVNELAEFSDSASFVLNNNYFRIALIKNDEGCTMRIVICHAGDIGSQDRSQYDLTVNLRKADGEPKLCLGNDNYVFATYLRSTDDKVPKE